MGRGRTVVVANAPSAESVQKLEALAGNPFTKNADFAAAVRACLSAPAAPPTEAEDLIGRVGFAIVSRLLEIFAGAAPRSAEEVPTDDAEEAPSHGAVVIEIARQFGQLATSGASLEGLDISQLVDALLQVETIRDRFRGEYGLPPELELDDIQLHRTGTTSAIFRCQWDGGTDVALKVTLARYFSVAALSEASATYGASLHGLPPDIAPQVHRSAARFIVLGFVDGDTLEERFRRIAQSKDDDRPDADRVEQAFEVLLTLMKDLELLATSKAALSARHHLDLTPNNVIVPRGKSVAELKLIDFGRNKLLVEPIAASSAAIARAAHYVAPEIREGILEESDTAYAAADAYSAGLLALETFAPGESQSLNDKLEKLWERSPGLAMILEDILVAKRAHRLQLVPAELRQMPFSYLRERLEGEREVEQEFGMELVQRGRFGDVLRLFGRPQQIARMYRVSKKFAGSGNVYARYRGLALWNVLAMLAWLSIWVVVLGLVAYQVGKGLHLDWLETRGAQLGEMLFQKFKSEHYPRDFWGREIGFSFGLMAFTYYTNIYAAVSFPITGGRGLETRARLANVMARSLAFVTPAPCIAGALFAPTIWPWATIFGVCWAAASNWAMARLHRAVWETTKETLGADTDPTGSTRHVFYEWALQMTIYAGGVAIIALALHFLKHSSVFPVNNVGAYVTVLTFLNLFFIVRLNCIQEAPKMRGFLQRTAYHLRRIGLAS